MKHLGALCSIKALVLVMIVFGAAPVAQGQGYQRPKPKTGYGPAPTNADLVAFDGAARTVVVQILNLTPYEIRFKSSSITSTDESEMQNRDRGTPKAFMFVPVGLPNVIPAAPAEAFNSNNDPNWENTTSRSYSMVFTWNDHKERVVDNWVQWTVKQVESCTLIGNTCTPYTQDVDLGLWMYRNETPDTLKAYFQANVLKDVLTATLRILGIVVDPARVGPWVREFLAMKEIADDYEAFDTLNSLAAGDDSKMYLASYVIPNPNSMCVLSNQGCVPSTMGPDETGTDGVYSLWPALYAGPCPAKTNCPIVAAEGELVVSAHLLRGKKAPMCPPDPPGNGTNYVCSLGQLPTFMITVMRHDDFGLGAIAAAAQSSPSAAAGTDKLRLFLLQAGAGSIRPLLERRGRLGLLTLRSLIQGLSFEQRQVFREMIRSMSSGRRPTKEERQLVHGLATALRERLK